MQDESGCDADHQAGLRYMWTPNRALSIKDFAAKYSPSKTKSTQAAWLWVQADPGPFKNPEERFRQDHAVEAAKKETDDLFDRLMDIDQDENLPVYTQTEGDGKTKAAHRKLAHERTARRLKAIMRKTNWVQGKWLLRSARDAIDEIWMAIACSVAAGPLRDAGVKWAAAETAVCYRDELTEGLLTHQQQHQVYLYLPNVFAIENVIKVLEALVSCHGIIPTGVKPDLYTAAGITSTHPSRIDSLVYRPKNHPLGTKEIDRLYHQFVEFEEIFGPGSKAMSLVELLPSGDEDDPGQISAVPSSPDVVLKTPKTQLQLARKPVQIRLGPDFDPPTRSLHRSRSFMKDFDGSGRSVRSPPSYVKSPVQIDQSSRTPRTVPLVSIAPMVLKDFTLRPAPKRPRGVEAEDVAKAQYTGRPLKRLIWPS